MTTLLSGKAGAYRAFHQATQSAISRLTIDYPIVHEINSLTAKQSHKLPKYLSRLGNDAPAIVDICSRTQLLGQIERTLDPTKVIGKLQTYRERLLHLASSVSFNPQVVDALAYALDLNVTPEETLSEQPEQLNWALLPPGEMKHHARDILQSKQRESGGQSYIDINRLNILENLRQWWGPDNSYYVKGLRTRRRNVKGEFEEIPDEYIMLILRTFDQNGTFLYENAVAESPVGGHNALYIQRYDVNGWQWSELMAYPKNDVQAMGARRLVHDPSDPYMIHNMTERAKTLLTIHPQAFLNGEFRGFDQEGKPYLHIPRNVMEIILSEQDNQ